MITGSAKVAGVVGSPVGHSLSPVIHNAWIAALRLDAAYVPFAPAEDGFERLTAGLAAGGVAGVNVTLPFKLRALRLSTFASDAAQAAGAANVLCFGPGGRVWADNTDGQGLTTALNGVRGWSAPAGPVVILGAGGAAAGAAIALIAAGAPEIRIVNRTAARALALAGTLGSRAWGCGFDQLDLASSNATTVINATPAGLSGAGELPSMEAAPRGAVFMDMVYKPLRTPFLREAAARGHSTVDGLAMLIGQARPSFEAFFGVSPPPPEVVDVRALCLQALGETDS